MHVCTHDIEVQVLGDPIAALFELVVKTHDIKSVESVDDGRAHVRGAEDAGAVTSLRDRPQFVFPPGVTHIVVPAVLHHLSTEKCERTFHLVRKRQFL